jgi:hypothetical protein
MTERFRRAKADQRRRLATVLWAGVLGTMIVACSYDWDHLDPSQGTASDSAGAPGQETGGQGSGGGGTGGQASGGQSSGTGGSTPVCVGSALTNSDFEDYKKEVPTAWALLNGAPNVVCGVEDAAPLVANGSTAMSVDATSAPPNDAYRALIGNTSGRVGASASGVELTGALAVRVEQLPSGTVSLLALFRPDSSSAFQERALATLSSTGDYQIVHGTAQLPAGTTEFGLAVSLPAGALVYIDEACTALE